MKYYLKYPNETYREAIDNTIKSFSSLEEIKSFIITTPNKSESAQVLTIFDENYSIHAKFEVSGSEIKELNLPDLLFQTSAAEYKEKELYRDGRKKIEQIDNVILANFTDQYASLLMRNGISQKKSNDDAKIFTLKGQS